MATDAYNLQFALGLGDRKLTSFTLRAAVNECVTLDTTEIALKESVQGLTREVVERNYRMVRWIWVGEELPEPGETVLAFIDGKAYAAERRVPEISEDPESPWWMVFKWPCPMSRWVDVVDDEKVTHWMPIPRGPE